MWYYSQTAVSMEVADDLVPVWRQAICNHYDDLNQSVHVKNLVPNVACKDKLPLHRLKVKYV